MITMEDMIPLVKDMEKISSKIGFVRTDSRFEGDHKFFYKIGESSFAPTAEEVGHMALLIGRNDANNPAYKWGARYMARYIQDLFRDNTLEYEKNIRSQILNELNESEYSEKMRETAIELKNLHKF